MKVLEHFDANDGLRPLKTSLAVPGGHDWDGGYAARDAMLGG